ncbi:MAG: hypothetical protein J6B88_03520 [Clostridia bacterium]|nr:hypothetical protein [Clostridia bacterium]
MTKEGLFIKNQFILWKDIEKITYTPEISSKFRARYTYATVFVKSQDKTNYSFDVLHFPAYALRRIKKYNPDIDIKFSKEGKGLILFFIIEIIIISVIIPLIK